MTEMEYRARLLNKPTKTTGDHVIYWMQRAQRSNWNHALEFALERANEKKLHLVVFFGLTENFPGANMRHYTFMLQGIAETARNLKRKGIGFVIRQTDPARGAVELARELNAESIVTDSGHLGIQRNWRRMAAELLDIPVFEVETDLVVPAWIASDRQETSARNMRRKLAPHLEWFLKPVEEGYPLIDTSSHSLETLDSDDTGALLSDLKLDSTASVSARFKGGALEAGKRWKLFLDEKLDSYHMNARDPGIEGTSLMSPYLHFGQISPLQLAVEAGGRQGAEAFLEQLIVRRELAVNMVCYSHRYDQYQSLPEWAKTTLEQHRTDPRERIYSLKELEAGQTGDEYWNAAQRELTETGYMHGYMRMYWGKKVIQWTGDPSEAFRHIIHLNNTYLLDGRDPGSYAGTAWCFGKHDRPFGTFPVTGSIRRLGSNLEKMRRSGSSVYNRYLERLTRQG